jgi:glucan phosphoethanolaminetransferase (alkaline phosphatase superfamily)
MPASPRPADRAYLLCTYALLSALPFLPALMGHLPAQAFQLLGIEVVAWAAVWSMCGRPAWFHWLLLPAFLALPVELYLTVYYGEGINTHHLGIIAETSPMEALEFLGSRVWLMAAVLAAVVLWWAHALKVATRTRALDWNGGARALTLAALGLLLLVSAYGHEFGVAAPTTLPPASAVAKTPAAPASPLVPGAHRLPWHWPPLPAALQLPADLNAFARSWPFGLMARGVDFYQERQHLARLSETSRNFRFGATQRAPDGKPEVVVLVLGESSRYDRWSLNGYARDTTPLLRQEANLVPLADVITPVSATRLSVPVIISRKPAMQSLKDGFSEKSLLTAFKEAGFKTWWLSNQISFGKFDTPVSVFAREADVVEFLNLGGFTDQSNLDGVLFEPFRQALADPAPRKLVVLHTLGSHWNYSHRYPKEFDHWQPSLYGIGKPVITDVRIKPRLNNSYDNSILYTDWFLHQLIGALKEGDVRSSLLYVADHGQTLYDGSCNQAFHGHNSQYEFHVPAFVWYSGHYAARYPDKVAQLKRHRHAPLATENMFHTLLDLGDLRYPGEQLARSFASPAYARHIRYVDSYGWSNYDNSTLKGDCREVIDKGKPLARTK